MHTDAQICTYLINCTYEFSEVRHHMLNIKKKPRKCSISMKSELSEQNILVVYL